MSDRFYLKSSKILIYRYIPQSIKQKWAKKVKEFVKVDPIPISIMTIVQYFQNILIILSFETSLLPLSYLVLSLAAYTISCLLYLAKYNIEKHYYNFQIHYTTQVTESACYHINLSSPVTIITIIEGQFALYHIIY